MIASFGDERTADLFHGLSGADEERLDVARRGLDLLNAAHSLEDLRVVRHARLEALEGRWRGWQRIRTDPVSLRFRWSGGVAHDVTLEARTPPSGYTP